MSVRERRPGYWEARVYRGYDGVTGKRVYATRSFRAASAREARDREAAFRAELAEDAAARPTKGTVGWMLDVWLDATRRTGREPTTLHGYAGIVRLIQADPLAAVSLDRLRVADVDGYYERLASAGRSPSRIGHHHAVLRMALTEAVRREHLTRNPAAFARRPSVRSKPVQPPANADVAAVLARAATIDPQLAVALRILAATGCRRGEACGLRWVDVTGDRVAIRRSIAQAGGKTFVKATKTHAERTVTVDPATAAILAAHRARALERADAFAVELHPAAHVVSDDPAGRIPWKPDRLTAAFGRLRDDMGFAGRLHDLRHWQASVLLDQGEQIPAVAARLGHRDAATTLRVYAHLMPGADARAAGIVGGLLGG